MFGLEGGLISPETSARQDEPATAMTADIIKKRAKK
jgi:hypothetical protein